MSYLGMGQYNQFGSLPGQLPTVAHPLGSSALSYKNTYAADSGSHYPAPLIRDPLGAKGTMVYELPHNATEVINLGTAVAFLMMTNDADNPNGYTSLITEVMPAIYMGQVLRRLEFRVRYYPQTPINRQAPYTLGRIPESFEWHVTTQLQRYGTAIKDSVESLKTPGGKVNHQNSLRQTALSMTEHFISLVISELFAARYRFEAVAIQNQLIGASNFYEHLMNEIKMFGCLNKYEKGWEIMVSRVMREMKSLGGSPSCVIHSLDADGLILGNSAYTEYYRGGPDAVVTRDGANRKFNNKGLAEYKVNSYPNRLVPDQDRYFEAPVQIGSFFPTNDQADCSGSANRLFAETYSSNMVSISICDVEKQKMVEIPVGTMLKQCHLFNAKGELRDPGLPFDERDYSKRGHYERVEDFLTLHGQSRHPIFRFDELLRNQLHAKPNVPSGSVELIGQIREEHLSTRDVVLAAQMLVHRVGQGPAIHKGLALYRNMCKQKPDTNFLRFVFKDRVIKAYLEKYPGKSVVNVNSNNAGIPSHLKRGILSGETYDAGLLDDLKSVLLERDPALEIDVLKPGSTRGFVPLPIYDPRIHPELEDASFGNLTGYANYLGFVAMATAYASNNPKVKRMYREEDLKTAFEFVEAMEDIGLKLKRMFPNAFHLSANEDQTPGESLAEQLFNMVGFPLWFNAKKALMHVRSDEGQKWFVDSFANPVTYEPDDARTKQIYGELVRAMIGSYFSSKGPGEGNLMESFLNVVETKTAAYTGNAAKDAISFAKTEDPNFWNEFGLNILANTMSAQLRELAFTAVQPTFSGALRSMGGFDPISHVSQAGFQSLNVIDSLPIYSNQLKLKIVEVVMSTVILIQNKPSDEFALHYAKLIGFLILTQTELLKVGLVTQPTTQNTNDYYDNMVKGLLGVVAKALGAGKGSKTTSANYYNQLKKELEEAAEASKRTFDFDKMPVVQHLKLTGKLKNLTVTSTPKDILELLLKKDGPAKTTIKQVLGLDYSQAQRTSNATAPMDMIGAKHGDLEGVWKHLDGLDGSGPLGFVRTPLSVSAEQLQDLFQMNGKLMMRDNYDVRVGNPYMPATYFGINAQTESNGQQKQVLKKMREVRTKYENEANKRFTSSNKTPALWHEAVFLGLDAMDLPLVGPIGGRRAARNTFAPGVRLENAPTNEFVNRLYALKSAAPDILTYAMGVAYMSAPLSEPTMRSLIDNNVLLPFKFVLARPHQNFRMSSLIFCARGAEDLGFLMVSCFNDSRVTSLVAEAYGNLSWWAGAVVTKPQNVFIEPHAAFVGFGHGNSTAFFDPLTYDPTGVNTYTTPNLENALKGTPSLMCFAVPRTDQSGNKIAFDLRGYYPDLNTGLASVPVPGESAHYNTAKRYSLIWKGWKSHKNGTVARRNRPEDRKQIFNTVVTMGYHQTRGPPTDLDACGAFLAPIEDKGHLGALAREGATSTFMGLATKTPFAV